jgi:alkylation response protein AidB-like acyl-CoA dehydrogenase
MRSPELAPHHAAIHSPLSFVFQEQAMSLSSVPASDAALPSAMTLAFEEDMVGRARRLADAFAERRERTLARRGVPPENIRDLHAAGFFKLQMPARWGGHDAPHTVCTRVVEALAKGCASTAWVFGVLGIHQMMMSLFSEQAQQEVWGDDATTLIASSLGPKPAVDAPDGGLVLQGDLPFSSGNEHARWAIVSGLSPTRGPIAALVPLSQVEIVDDWQVLGLRGTGSSSLRLNGVHVPPHRLASFFGCMGGVREVNAAYPGSLWDAKAPGFFGLYNFACVPLGIAGRALEIATDMMRTPGVQGHMRGTMETLQLKYAEAAADIDMARFVMIERCRQYDARQARGDSPTQADYLVHKRDISRMVWRLRAAVERLTEINNGWVYDASPMQECLRDVITASAHRSANQEDSMLPFAKAAIGL